MRHTVAGQRVHTCLACRVTFIGADAVHRWSKHTWTHADEVRHLVEVGPRIGVVLPRS